NIGGSGIKIIQFVYIPVTIILTLMLWYIVMKTKLGRAMRAVSQDADAAALMGINVDSVIRKAFMLGGLMAGIAGTLVGVQSLIEPMMGFMPGLKAFIAAVLGGIGSIPGAVIGGFAIGVIENMVVWCGIPTGYKDIAAFIVLILVLVVKPQGLLGKTEKEKV
ncbi:MAG: branched-chain amino acid ABC transporter permease, partial [Victivallales bacterium]